MSAASRLNCSTSSSRRDPSAALLMIAGLLAHKSGPTSLARPYHEPRGGIFVAHRSNLGRADGFRSRAPPGTRWGGSHATDIQAHLERLAPGDPARAMGAPRAPAVPPPGAAPRVARRPWRCDPDRR